MFDCFPFAMATVIPDHFSPKSESCHGGRRHKLSGGKAKKSGTFFSLAILFLWDFSSLVVVAFLTKESQKSVGCCTPSEGRDEEDEACLVLY